ncbi:MULTISPECIES: acyl carrier protein [unclassified Pseudomonas]|uniref:acyl carrier protein n=1 Tax=unclassified Pseudomonas TaxID=196821 RepID=UPI0039B74C62
MSVSIAEGCVDTGVIKLLSRCFSTRQREITRHSRLVEDLQMDSVDVVEVAMRVDDAFCVELSSDQVAGWRSVGDIVASVLEAKVLKRK